MVLDRRAGQGEAPRGRQRPCRLRLFRLRVLDVLRLVEDDRRPRHLLEHLGITVQERVTGENQSIFLRLLGERRSFLAGDAVVDQHETRTGGDGVLEELERRRHARDHAIDVGPTGHLEAVGAVVVKGGDVEQVVQKADNLVRWGHWSIQEEVS